MRRGGHWRVTKSEKKTTVWWVIASPSGAPFGDRRPVDDMAYPEQSEYEEGEEYYYDDDGAFGVDPPPRVEAGRVDEEW